MILVNSIFFSILLYSSCSFVHRLTHLKVMTRVQRIWFKGLCFDASVLVSEGLSEETRRVV